MGEKKEKKPKLKLIGEDGNAFAIMGRCREAARKAKWPEERITAMLAAMRSGDYSHLLGVVTDNFEVR